MRNIYKFLGLAVVIYLYTYNRNIFEEPTLENYTTDWSERFSQICNPILPRYTHLKTKKWYIAMNLHNNDDVFHFLRLNLIELHKFNPNSFLSIYESGSMDNTKANLELLKTELEMKHKIVMGDEILTNDLNRIDFLVKVRNKALKFLTSDFDSILFINDVFFCPNDILELEFQRDVQQAGIAGGMDYDLTAEHNKLHFHDYWVAMDINGYQLNREVYQNPMRSIYNKFRWNKQLPMQVLSVWNGMVSLDATPFLNGLQFRRYTGDKQAGECSTSECTTLSLDLFKLGYRAILVPRVKVAYTFLAFKFMKVDNSYFKHLYPPNTQFVVNENLVIPWKPYGSSFFCIPYSNKQTGWHPDEFAEYWESLPTSPLNK